MVAEVAAGMTAEVVTLLELREKHEREKHVLTLLGQLRYMNLAGQFVREFQFHPDRKWRLDLYCPWARLGVELHGGTWSGGRHVTGRGFAADREKMNAAIERGLRVLEYTGREVKSGVAALQIERILADKENVVR